MSRPKHHLFAIVALLFTLRRACLSQVPPHIYIPFSVESAEWLVLQYDTINNPAGTHTYLIQGDTLLSGIDAKKVWKDSLFFGTVYDDSLNRTVYFAPGGSSVFTTLYGLNSEWDIPIPSDYYLLGQADCGNLNPGVNNSWYWFMAGKCRQVKMVMPLGYAELTPISFWVEGIGAFSDLNSNSPGGFQIGTGPFLPLYEGPPYGWCSTPLFTRTTTLKYRCCGMPWDTLVSLGSTCSPLLSVHEKKPASGSFQFSPHPLMATSTLTSGSETASGGTLIVTDLHGREMLNLSYHAGDVVQIKRSQFPSVGLYLFQYISMSGIPARGKILVQDE